MVNRLCCALPARDELNICRQRLTARLILSDEQGAISLFLAFKLRWWIEDWMKRRNHTDNLNIKSVSFSFSKTKKKKRSKLFNGSQLAYTLHTHIALTISFGWFLYAWWVSFTFPSNPIFFFFFFSFNFRMLGIVYVQNYSPLYCDRFVRESLFPIHLHYCSRYVHNFTYRDWFIWRFFGAWDKCSISCRIRWFFFSCGRMHTSKASTICFSGRGRWLPSGIKTFSINVCMVHTAQCAGTDQSYFLNMINVPRSKTHVHCHTVSRPAHITHAVRLFVAFKLLFVMIKSRHEIHSCRAKCDAKYERREFIGPPSGLTGRPCCFFCTWIRHPIAIYEVCAEPQ